MPTVTAPLDKLTDGKRIPQETAADPIGQELTSQHRNSPYGWFKVVFDFTLALFILVLATPFILLAMLLVKLTSRGPALYLQQRVGLNGRLFTIYKIRSMFQNAEDLTGASWCLEGDTRITPVGWVLRKLHLDELPQLWNVLCGEMSLTGPRPERPEFVPQLEQALRGYRVRIAVRPGLTGLAQVQLPPDTNLDSVRRKLMFDIHYVCNISLWLDLKILAATVFKVVHIPFPVICKVFGFPQRRSIEKTYRQLVGEEAEVESDAIAAGK